MLKDAVKKEENIAQEEIKTDEKKVIVDAKKDGQKPTKKAPDKELVFDPKSANLKPGMIVRIHQKIKEKNSKGELKERVQIFEGRIIAMKHGLEPGATITVRKISEGIGVEKIFPLFSPNIIKIEIKKVARVRRAKLYFLRNYKKRLEEKLVS